MRPGLRPLRHLGDCTAAITRQAAITSYFSACAFRLRVHDTFLERGKNFPAQLRMKRKAMTLAADQQYLATEVDKRLDPVTYFKARTVAVLDKVPQVAGVREEQQAHKKTIAAVRKAASTMLVRAGVRQPAQSPKPKPKGLLDDVKGFFSLDFARIAGKSQESVPDVLNTPTGVRFNHADLRSEQVRSVLQNNPKVAIALKSLHASPVSAKARRRRPTGRRKSFRGHRVVGGSGEVSPASTDSSRSASPTLTPSESGSTARSYQQRHSSRRVGTGGASNTSIEACAICHEAHLATDLCELNREIARSVVLLSRLLITQQPCGSWFADSNVFFVPPRYSSLATDAIGDHMDSHPIMLRPLVSAGSPRRNGRNRANGKGQRNRPQRSQESTRSLARSTVLRILEQKSVDQRSRLRRRADANDSQSLRHRPKRPSSADTVVSGGSVTTHVTAQYLSRHGSFTGELPSTASSLDDAQSSVAAPAPVSRVSMTLDGEYVGTDGNGKSMPVAFPTSGPSNSGTGPRSRTAGHHPPCSAATARRGKGKNRFKALHPVTIDVASQPMFESLLEGEDIALQADWAFREDIRHREDMFANFFAATNLDAAVMDMAQGTASPEPASTRGRGTNQRNPRARADTLAETRKQTSSRPRRPSIIAPVPTRALQGGDTEGGEQPETSQD